MQGRSHKEPRGGKHQDSEDNLFESSQHQFGGRNVAGLLDAENKLYQLQIQIMKRKIQQLQNKLKDHPNCPAYLEGSSPSSAEIQLQAKYHRKQCAKLKAENEQLFSELQLVQKRLQSKQAIQLQLRKKLAIQKERVQSLKRQLIQRPSLPTFNRDRSRDDQLKFYSDSPRAQVNQPERINVFDQVRQEGEWPRKERQGRVREEEGWWRKDRAKEESKWSSQERQDRQDSKKEPETRPKPSSNDRYNQGTLNQRKDRPTKIDQQLNDLKMKYQPTPRFAGAKEKKTNQDRTRDMFFLKQSNCRIPNPELARAEPKAGFPPRKEQSNSPPAKLPREPAGPERLQTPRIVPYYLQGLRHEESGHKPQ